MTSVVTLVVGLFFQLAPISVVSNYSNYHRVEVIRDGQPPQELTTTAPDVATALRELGINLTSLDYVIPAVETPITENNFVIEIKKGSYVVVNDDNQGYRGGWTTESELLAIVEALGYTLGEQDRVVSDPHHFNNDLLNVRSLRILRNHTYELNLDGKKLECDSIFHQVKEILEECQHLREDIAYVSPELDQSVDPADKIILYSKKDDQKINETQIVETSNDSDNRHSEVTQKVVYLNKLDAQGNVLEKQEIDKQVIGRLTISFKDEAPSAALVATSTSVSNQTVASVRRPPAQADLSPVSPALKPAEKALEAPSNAHGHSEEATLTDQQKTWLVAAGIAKSDWFFVDYIVTKESNWQPYVWNYAGSSAYGLCQTMMSLYRGEVAEDFDINPVSQLQWCDQYAKKRYGSWHNAYHFKQNNRWW